MSELITLKSIETKLNIKSDKKIKQNCADADLILRREKEYAISIINSVDMPNHFEP